MPGPSLRRIARPAWIAFSLLAVLAGSVWASEKWLRYRKIDVNHSTVAFKVPILGGMSEVYGQFNEFEVEIDWPSEATEDLSDCRFKAVIQVSSIDTGIPGRDEHLRQADFFDAENHPTITFASDTIQKVEKGYLVEGKLTIRGKTRSVRFPFEFTGRKASESGKVMVGFKAEGVIDRQDYGVAWRHPDPEFVGDQVRFELRILTKLRAPE